jgi:gas vesicle protein
VLLVLDATTGQNAVNQAREFAKIAEITGIILTKLDGTARGGVVLSIKNDLKVPVKFVGVGEGIDDLQPFNPHAFAEGLFEALPEDFKEDEIDLSEIREELPENEESNELKEIFEEVVEAFNEIKEDVSEEIEEFKEDVKETVEEIKEEVKEEINEVVEEIDERIEEMQEEVDAIDAEAEEAVTSDSDDEPKKKKGFFGRLFK